MIRFLRFAGDLARANAGGQRPFKLTYAVTDNCSCHCRICSLWKRPRPGAGLEEIDRLFRANPHLSWINLTGGEVVERDDFVEILASARRRTRVYALAFPTAGQQPGEIARKVQEVLRLRLPRLFVTVSLDGPPEVHDRLRGAKGAFERAAETLRRLKEFSSRRFQVRAGLTLSSLNDARPEQLVADLLEAAPFLDRTDLHFNLAHHSPHAYANGPEVIPESGKALSLLAGEVLRRKAGCGPLPLLEAAYWKLSHRFLATGRSPIPCGALAASAFVSPDLYLFPCVSWDHPLLDLRTVDYSLEAGLRHAEAIRARQRARAGECPVCWTPCEAFPTMLSGMARVGVACLRGGKEARASEGRS
ncbi:MAG: radical SAM protein [Planctomycetota bacterium]